MMTIAMAMTMTMPTTTMMIFRHLLSKVSYDPLSTRCDSRRLSSQTIQTISATLRDHHMTRPKGFLIQTRLEDSSGLLFWRSSCIRASRFPMLSGTVESWLVDTSNSTKLTSSPKLSGNLVRLLVCSNKYRNLTSWPKLSGNVIRWLRSRPRSSNATSWPNVSGSLVSWLLPKASVLRCTS